MSGLSSNMQERAFCRAGLARAVSRLPALTNHWFLSDDIGHHRPKANDQMIGTLSATRSVLFQLQMRTPEYSQPKPQESAPQTQPSLETTPPTVPDFAPSRVTEDPVEAYYRKYSLPTWEQALASNAELPPANSTDPDVDNYVGNIHTEIKVNGKVIARVYNSGGVEIADEYAFVLHGLFENDSGYGPDLAEDRAKRIMAALTANGAVTQDDIDRAGPFDTTLIGKPVAELLLAETAMTQAEWLAEKAKRGPLDPGTLFSRTV